jgi:periplasmic divalent cation tolerance protein
MSLDWKNSGGILTDKVVVMVTTGKPGEARKIAKQLVESKLAACVNITQPIRSVYRWQGKLVDDKEFILLIKTSRELFPAIQAEIARLHSYKTPEIICLPIIDGSADYLNWLADSLKVAPQDEIPSTPENE